MLYLDSFQDFSLRQYRHVLAARTARSRVRTKIFHISLDIFRQILSYPAKVIKKIPRKLLQRF